MKLIAYLDPGTGSLIIQAVLGGAAGVTMLVKTKGRRLLKKQNKAAIADNVTPSADGVTDPSDTPVAPPSS